MASFDVVAGGVFKGGDAVVDGDGAGGCGGKTAVADKWQDGALGGLEVAIFPECINGAVTNAQQFLHHDDALGVTPGATARSGKQWRISWAFYSETALAKGW